MMTFFDAAVLAVVLLGIAASVGVFMRTAPARRLQELLGFGDTPEWVRR